MTPYQVNKLDRLYQIRILNLYGWHSVVSGLIAQVAHHYVPKSRGYSTRWFIPNGIALTDDEHKLAHSKDKYRILPLINDVMGGSDWLKLLNEQQNKTCKNLKYETVKEYLEGKIDNYC